MRLTRLRLHFQSQNKVGLYFGLQPGNLACAPFTCVHFTENQGNQELV